MRPDLKKKKTCNEYFLSVDGETEKWYFEHLQGLINNNEDAKFAVKIESKISSPAQRFIGMTIPFEIVRAFHICDYESRDQQHMTRFTNTLKEIKDVKKKLYKI